MNIIYLGFFDNKFKYRIELNGHSFDYFTGCGWVTFKRPTVWKEYKNQWGDVSDRKQVLDPNYTAIADHEKGAVLAAQCSVSLPKNERYGLRTIYRRIPSENDILECLQSDCYFGEMSFYEFCDELGYSKDSIKDQEIHRQCMKTADKLRGFKFPDFNEEEEAV